MGHLGHLKEEYRALVDRLDATAVGMPEPRDPRAWHGWKEILEILYTPEEAELVSKIPVRPLGLDKLAAHVGLPPEELKARLEPMCDKGIIVDLVHPQTGEAKYLVSPPVVGFFEFSMMRAHDSIPKKRMAEALEAYAHGDPTFAEELFGGETVVGRAMVHETALGDTPLPDVLDWERASTVIDQARSWAVAICYCRHKNEHLGTACDAPQNVCLSLDAGADFVVRREFGKAIDKRDAMTIMEESRKSGLVQIADNVQNKPTYICNCCGCCCGQLTSINDFALPAVNPSNFVAEPDLEQCAGCARCIRACPITAIGLSVQRVRGKRKNDVVPDVDAASCIGCGVCATACKKGAMKMKQRECRSKVPVNAIERSLRMAIERGRLGNLLFDEGSSRGNEFVGQIVRTLTSLPLAKRALASEQVSSRFVRAALARVGKGFDF